MKIATLILLISSSIAFAGGGSGTMLSFPGNRFEVSDVKESVRTNPDWQNILNARANSGGRQNTTGLESFGSEDLIKYADRVSQQKPTTASGFEVMGQSNKSYEMAVLGAEKHAREHCGVRRAIRTTAWVYKYDESFPGYDSGCDASDPGFCQPTQPIRTFTARAKFKCAPTE